MANQPLLRNWLQKLAYRIRRNNAK